MFESLKTIHRNAYGKKNIHNDEQLIRWIPFRYKDYSHTTPLRASEFAEGARDIAVLGTIDSIEKKTSKGKELTVVKATDENGVKFSVTYMHRNNVGAWLASLSGSPVLFIGRFNYHPYIGFSSFNAEFTGRVQQAMKIVPVYHHVKGVAVDTMQKHMDACLPEVSEDTIPQRCLGKYPTLGEAFRMVHHPVNMEEPYFGSARLVLDDQVYFHAQLRIMNSHIPSSFAFSRFEETEEMLQSLSYQLTGDQQRTIESIVKSTLAGNRVNALVQGDVGCGKTIVAFALMRCAAENGYQSIIMAPTQILAKQHFEELQKLVPPEQIAFFDGTVKAKEKETFRQAIADGTVRYIVGTSALLFSDLDLSNVGISIVDEEHRFGVAQRSGIIPPEAHIVTMSATPIPRSLAQVVYGEGTDVYQILEKPAGRLETKTYYNNGERVDAFIEGALNSGNQVYVVCPLKDEAEEDSLMEDVISVEEVYEKYKKFLEPKGYAVGCVTGNSSAKEKAKILDDFKNGITKVLVSTTVIEVGVNVPSANVMVILNAERFGLAALHQLRGRIGRGNAQGYCLLVSKEMNSRIEAMCRTTNGFEIAEADLQERRSGDLLGLKQSGKNRFVEEMLTYPYIRDDAKKVLKEMTEKEIERHMKKYRKIYPLDAEEDES